MTESISILKEYIEHLECMKKNADKFFDREQADKDIETFKMAIKALEQEPCEDAISREDALMALTGEWTETTDEIIHRFIKRIKSLPSVKPQPRWIPVSERLPEPNRKDEAGNDIAFLVQTEWGTFFTATYDGNWCYVDSSTLVESDVIAWMSLPKPYEPQKSEISE